MEKTSFQQPELRNSSNTIIQQGTYGKNTAFCNSQNTGILDYINNNLTVLNNAMETMGATIDSDGNPHLPSSVLTEIETAKTATATYVTSVKNAACNAIDTFKDTTVAEVTSIKNQSITAIENKGATTLASIPADYSQKVDRDSLATVAFSGKYSDLTGLPDLSGSGAGGNVYQLLKVDFTAADWTAIEGGYRLGTSHADIIDVYYLADDNSYHKTFTRIERTTTATLYSLVAFAGFYTYGTNLTAVTDSQGRNISETYALKSELTTAEGNISQNTSDITTLSSQKVDKSNTTSFTISSGEKSLVGGSDESLKWAGNDVDIIAAQGNNYIRYASGKQICWNSSDSFNIGASSIEVKTVYYSVSFISTPTVIAIANNPHIICSVPSSYLTNDYAGIQYKNTVASAINGVVIKTISIGKWK